MEISEICFEFCNDFLNFQNLVDEILIPPLGDIFKRKFQIGNSENTVSILIEFFR